MERIRLDKLLSNRGYCSRREVPKVLKMYEVREGEEDVLKADQKVNPELITIDGEPLDPGTGLVVMLHKPTGFVCSHRDKGRLIFELLPERWGGRNPPLSSVGRLDKETSGLLILTDDGDLNHRLTSPKHHVPKCYEVETQFHMNGDEQEIFASGNLILDGERDPLLPARFEPLSPTTGSLTIFEGRYHQVRRMFEVLGNKVIRLHRSSIGSVTLSDLPEGEWRIISKEDLEALHTLPLAVKEWSEGREITQRKKLL